ncbi:MAG: insecticidal delta-endotoxin Cry8Ea1 family protein [Phyllobacterium sp.]
MDYSQQLSLNTPSYGDINDDLRTIIATMLGEIPELGGILEGLAYLLWPDSGTDIWQQIEQDVEQLIDQKIDGEVYSRVQSALVGLQNAVNDYSAAIQDKSTSPAYRGEKYSSLETAFATSAPYFQESGYEVLLLPLFAQMANLHLSLLRDGVTYGQTFGWNDADVAEQAILLTDTVNQYVNYAYSTYNTYLQGLHYSPYTDSAAQVQNDWNFICSYMSQTNLSVLDYAYYWPYFDVSLYPGAVQVPPPPRLIYSNIIGSITDNNTPQDPRELPQSFNGISAITISAGSYLQEMTVQQTDGHSYVIGETTATLYPTVVVSAGNPIVTVSSWSGSTIDALAFTFADGSSTGRMGGSGGNAASWNFTNEYLAGFRWLSLNWDMSNSVGAITCAFTMENNSSALPTPETAPVVDWHTFIANAPFPSANQPVWPSDAGVSYAVAYFNANGQGSIGPWSDPVGATYALPEQISLPIDSSGIATGRYLYRRFVSSANVPSQPQLVHVIWNNTDTISGDYNFLPTPVLAPAVDPRTFAKTAPLPPDSPNPVWPADANVCYAVTFYSTINDGVVCESMLSPWSTPMGATYALPQRIAIPTDPTGMAEGRFLYRRFQLGDNTFTLPECVLQIANNSDHFCADNNYTGPIKS